MVGLEEPVVRAMETNRVEKGEKRIPNTLMRAGSSKEGGKEEKKKREALPPTTGWLQVIHSAIIARC